MLHFRPTKIQASLCRLTLAFVTNIHKLWMQIKTRTKFGPLVQLDASKAFNWPTQRHLRRWHAPINKFRRVQPSNQSMASGFNSLHAGIFSMLFVICWFYLILVQTVYQGYQQAALVYKEYGQAPLSTSSPGSPKSLSWYWLIRTGSTRWWQVKSSLKL